MGCCGSKSSSAGTTSVNLSQNKDKREANWRATGQIILRDSNLKELPASIADIGIAAKTLDAKNNKITELPPSLGSLKSVQRLVLANNALENLHHVTLLTNLKALIVDYNQLGHLPAQIGSLERLETLSCSHNLLLSLPASIGNLKALKFLDCSSNKIVSLPLELGNATAVEEINASDNYLQEIPGAIGQLTALKTLKLDKNQIRAIPSKVLQGCSPLQALNLHSNPITPQSLEETPGFPEFESRRQKKVTKQMAGGAIQNLEEGVDRKLAEKAK